MTNNSKKTKGETMNNKFNLLRFIRKNKNILVTTTIISISLANIPTARAENMNSDTNELITQGVTNSTIEGMHSILLGSLHETLELGQLELLSNLLLNENEVSLYLEDAL